MSRIGKKPIKVASGVTVTVTPANEIVVKGPKGELKQAIDRDINVEVKDGEVLITRPTDQIRHRALHGLYRSLVAYMMVGVTDGFKRELELVGVGYRAAVVGQQIDPQFFLSHLWRATTQHLHLQSRFDVAQIEFHIPALRVKLRQLALP